MRRGLAIVAILSPLVVILAVSETRTTASWLSDATGINIDLNRQVGTGISSLAGPTVEQFEQSGNRLIDRLSESVGKQGAELLKTASATAEELIRKADKAAGERLTQIDGIMAKSITQMDDSIATHLRQLDQLAEVRLGNLDTIATKSLANVEGVFRRIVLFAAFVVLIAAVVWRGYVLWSTRTTRTRGRYLEAMSATAVLIALLFAAVYFKLPSESTAAELKQRHLALFDTSLKALDFRNARFHAAQLRILDPTEPSIIGLEAKAEVVRDSLTRPTVYRSVAGLRELNEKFRLAWTFLPNDPDLRTVSALSLWYAGASREAEYAAARTAFEALREREQFAASLDLTGDEATVRQQRQERQRFALGPLALALVEDYLVHPLSTDVTIRTVAGAQEAPGMGGWAATVAQARSLYQGDDSLSPLANLAAFHRSLRELYRTSVPAYSEMIQAHARAAIAPDGEKKKWTDLRAARANTLVEAWTLFDRRLRSDPAISGTAIQLLAFSVNDAMYSRARAYQDPAVPADGAGPGVFDASLRKSWFTTFVASQLAADVGSALEQQERLAFTILDEELRLFEQSMIAFRKAVGVETRINAAILSAASDAGVRAARLGLFTCGGADGRCGDGAAPTSFVDAIVVDRNDALSDSFKKQNEASEREKFIAAQRERSLWRPAVRARI